MPPNTIERKDGLRTWRAEFGFDDGHQPEAPLPHGTVDRHAEFLTDQLAQAGLWALRRLGGLTNPPENPDGSRGVWWVSIELGVYVIDDDGLLTWERDSDAKSYMAYRSDDGRTTTWHRNESPTEPDQHHGVTLASGQGER